MVAFANLDMYRKIPVELLESTKRGSFMSIASLLVMTTLVALETKTFLTSTTVTDLKLDTSNKERSSRVAFNITFMDLKCDFISIDQVSVFGTEQNIRNTITKRSIDDQGIHKFYEHSSAPKRNAKEQLELYDSTVTETLEELHQNGVDAVSLTPDTFTSALKDNKIVFVDFYANWCSHCRDLLPTWETLAEIMNQAPVEIVKRRISKNHEELEKKMTEGHGGHLDGPNSWTAEHLQHAETGLKAPVFIAKVDCVEHSAFCFHHMIMAYPTLRLFIDGEVFGGDYYGHRTVLDFTDYLATVEEHYMEETGGVLSETHEISKDQHKRRILKNFYGYEDENGNAVDYYGNSPEEDPARSSKLPGRYAGKIMEEWIEKDHPGCEVSGHLILDRVPGNFQIFARSDEHDLVPQMTNLSHFINGLTFEDYDVESGRRERVSSDIHQKVHSLDNTQFVTTNLHEAYHHYIKLVSTHLGLNGRRHYQMVVNSQIAYYKPDVTPIAKIQYDYSPVSVTYHERGRKWYEYLTSLLAIVGGMFTVIGMLEGSLHAITRKKRF